MPASWLYPAAVCRQALRSLSFEHARPMLRSAWDRAQTAAYRIEEYRASVTPVDDDASGEEIVERVVQTQSTLGPLRCRDLMIALVVDSDARWLWTFHEHRPTLQAALKTGHLDANAKRQVKLARLWLEIIDVAANMQAQRGAAPPFSDAHYVVTNDEVAAYPGWDLTPRSWDEFGDELRRVFYWHWSSAAEGEARRATMARISGLHGRHRDFDETLSEVERELAAAI